MTALNDNVDSDLLTTFHQFRKSERLKLNEAIDLRVNGGWCFICFSKPEGVNPKSENGVTVSLRCLLLYLKLGELPNLTVGLCSGCEGIYGKFVELYQLREMLDMELEFLLRNLKGKMETGHKLAKSADVEAMEKLEVLKVSAEMRKLILQNAKIKISNRKPLLSLDKLSPPKGVVRFQFQATSDSKSVHNKPVTTTDGGANDNDDDIPVPIIEIPLDIGQIEVKLERPEPHQKLQYSEESSSINVVDVNLEESETEALVEAEDTSKSKGDDHLDSDFDPASASGKEDTSDSDSDFSPPAPSKRKKSLRVIKPKPRGRTRSLGPLPPSGKNSYKVLRDGWLRCKLCPENNQKIFQSKKAWRMHFLYGHQGLHPGPEGTQTRYCSFNKATGKFTCLVCKREYVNKTGFSTHYRTDHLGVRYECDQCKRTFTARNTMTKHKVTCRGLQKPARELTCFCKQCGKGFTTPAWLREHEQAVHEGVRFQCEKCPKAFRYKHGLRRHSCTNKLEKLDDTRFDCKYCGARFQSYVRLRDHQRGTFLKKKMSCSVCHLQTTHSCRLKRHQEEGKCDGVPKEVDPNGPEFYCELCQKEFTTAGGLRCHRASIHLGSRFRCDRCNRPFTNKTNLYRHKKTCTGTTPKVKKKVGVSVWRRPGSNYNPKHKCDYMGCNRKFAQLEFLLKHTEHDHPDRILEPPTELEKAPDLEEAEERKHPFRRENGEVICNECGFSFSEKKGFFLHFRLVHRAALFQCDKCENAFLLKKQLLTHYRQCVGWQKGKL